jgi:predicted transcriptional regulator
VNRGGPESMEEKKHETFKIKRETHPVSQQAKDNLKYFNSLKKKILESMGEEELSIPQIAERIEMSRAETLYYVMTLLKFGLIQVLRIDEYYIYRVKK